MVSGETFTSGKMLDYDLHKHLTDSLGGRAIVLYEGDSSVVLNVQNISHILIVHGDDE